MYREGIVEEIDAAKHRVRCLLIDRDNILSPWLKVMVQSSRDDFGYGLPTKGQTVAILLDERDEAGCVLGALYSDTDPPPAESSETARGMTFRDGTIVEFDAATSILRVVLPSGGVLELAGSAAFVALANLVMDNLNGIDGDLTAIQTTLGTGIAPPGGGPVTFGSPYVKAYAPAEVASAQVKSA